MAKVRYAILAMIIILALAIGFIFGRLNWKNDDSSPQENHQKGYRYISPLLTCADTNPSGLMGSHLKDSLTSLIDEKIENNDVNHVSVYFRDLNNGPWVGIDEKEKFSPASLMKVPLMITALKLAENDPDFLEKKVTISQEDQGSTIPNILADENVAVGGQYTIEELIERMIKDSDNLAANAIIGNIPGDKLEETYDDLNIEPPTEEMPENFMTVLDYSSFFRILYNSSYLNRASSEKALEILATTSFQKGLVAGLPDNTKIAHKFGERVINDTKQLHDCGIIYPSKAGNYLLCVMTRGDDFDKMENTIKEISALVYQEFVIAKK